MVEWEQFRNIKLKIPTTQKGEWDILEATYLFNVLKALQQILQNEFFDYEFWIYSQQSHETTEQQLPHSNKKQVVFIIGDELGRIPYELAKQATVIFKNYIKLNSGVPNVFYFPLGYNKNTLNQEVKPINFRSYNVFFSGNLHHGRVNLYKSLINERFIPASVLIKFRFLWGSDFDKKYIKSYIRFQNGFASGLSSAEYADKLYNTKIVLCPPGYVNPETFRHYEALRAGCIVISEDLPIMHAYPNSPIISIKNWRDLPSLVHHLLLSPDKMQEYQDRVLLWYNSYLKEEKIAGQIADILKEIQR